MRFVEGQSTFIVPLAGSWNKQQRNAGILHCVQDDGFLAGAAFFLGKAMLILG
jgi:hypothetical protein